ncbi:MAG: hypothetical protein ACJAZ9_000442 [Neolewinella sp.]|jgi:hypothetical protein
MEPLDKEKPSIGLFFLMTLAYFGAFFGLKYGVFGGNIPWYYNLGLILACLILAMALRNRSRA